MLLSLRQRNSIVRKKFKGCIPDWIQRNPKCKQLERGAADARGPYWLRSASVAFSTRRQAGRVWIWRSDGTALGRGHGTAPADARGPYWYGSTRWPSRPTASRSCLGLLIGRYGSGTRPRDSATDARGPYWFGQRRGLLDPTGSRSCLDLMIGRYGSGTRPRDSAGRPSRAILDGSGRSPSRRTGSSSRPGQMIGTVRLWDPTTGQCRQTLKGMPTVTSLSFSRDGYYLNTDRGIQILNSSTLGTHHNLEQPTHVMFVNKTWVTQGTQNLLWLPPEYRDPSSSAVHDNILALGYRSGQVIVFEFAFP